MRKARDVFSIGGIAEDAYIGDNVEIGKGVSIGSGAIIHDHVCIGDGCIIGPHVVLGEPLEAQYTQEGYENPPTIIGDGAIIRSGTVIYAGTTIGPGFRSGHQALIREFCTFGEGCSVGTASQVSEYVTFGDHSRFHSMAFLGAYTTIGNFVSGYPYVITLGSVHPPCPDCWEAPVIEDFVVLSTHAIIYPRVRVGKNAVISAGAVVTRDVAPGTLVVGMPGRGIRRVEDIRCEKGIYERAYPWQENFVGGNYPWERKKTKGAGGIGRR
ncbi:MAG: hypothetical protein H5T64_00515 [Chloroflexi bacterium]|nr:hypothetical protein [Chloroflexota bacterium]